LRRILRRRTSEIPTNKMAKEIKKVVKEVKKEVKEVKVLDGVYQIDNGYQIVVNGVKKEFIGENLSAFNAALGEYKVAKSL